MTRNAPISPKADALQPFASRTLASVLPVMLETAGWADYALIDSGHGRKLERYGAITVVRPEEQALWAPRLSEARWDQADAVFTGDVEEEGPGRWRFAGHQPESWQMRFGPAEFLCRFTSFRHVGVFPEQAAHWTWMAERIAKRMTDEPGRPAPKLLNLFGYTGLASLIAAEAGAHVTHVDASKKAIAWARENQAMSGMQGLPIRWICEDAMKFVAREARRGNTYDAIVLDPPKYGRGTNGEVWQLFEHLPDMLRLCRELTAEKPLFVILTVYAMRASFVSFHELVAEIFGSRGGRLESGELLIREEGADGRRLATSLFCRWSPEGTP
ncbi:MAG: class I SAM-dependent methyltransferase [Ancalomicrobiaceae bacterium]|nr:class I SAM-dependent methyltransferase [Ancalomicrobiaceae bacterium]